jgi:hypothetical protein
MPHAVELARFSGWTWNRDGDHGPVVKLDRSGAWVAALSSVRVVHGGYKNTGPVDEIPRSPRPGYYLVTWYPWTETGMPHPLGHGKPSDQVWIAAPRAGLLRELAEAGRWPDASAAESWTGEPCSLWEWATFINELRNYARTVHGHHSDADDAVKKAYGMALSMMLGDWAEDTARPVRVWKCKNRRTDWRQHTEDQGAVTLWRAADECHQVAADLGPVSLRNTDELHIPAAAFDAVTTVVLPGRKRPPVRIDPLGIQLGTFKDKSREEV